MLSRTPCLCAAVLLQIARQAGAQSTVIHRATPDAVVEHLSGQLLAGGWTLDHADDKSALFTLDRGVVAQQSGRIPFAHIVIEALFRFKRKSEGVAVTADETVVGERGRPLEFRRPVESEKERHSLQLLLDSVRVELEASPPPARPDSGHL